MRDRQGVILFENFRNRLKSNRQTKFWETETKGYRNGKLLGPGMGAPPQYASDPMEAPPWQAHYLLGEGSESGGEERSGPRREIVSFRSCVRRAVAVSHVRSEGTSPPGGVYLLSFGAAGFIFYLLGKGSPLPHILPISFS